MDVVVVADVVLDVVVDVVPDVVVDVIVAAAAVAAAIMAAAIMAAAAAITTMCGVPPKGARPSAKASVPAIGRDSATVPGAGFPLREMTAGESPTKAPAAAAINSRKYES